MQAVEEIGVNRPSLTIEKRVGCGHIHVTFIEHKNGNFYKIMIRGTMTKEADCGATFLDSFSRILTLSLRICLEDDQKTKKKDFKETMLWKGILKQMVGQSCNRRSMVTETSCVSAIASAIKDYVKRKEQ